MDAGKVFQTVCFHKLLKKIENGLKGGKNISATLGNQSNPELKPISYVFPRLKLSAFL